VSGGQIFRRLKSGLHKSMIKKITLLLDVKPPGVVDAYERSEDYSPASFTLKMHAQLF
jgi:hypothetical protein